MAILSLFAIMTLFLHLLGKINGKEKQYDTKKEIIQSNPYIYYRELPNSFGVGVSSLLLNSKIKQQQDIVAILLNLCAKKYLKLKEENGSYTITVLKGIDQNLLSNEKYILYHVMTNTLNEIDYEEFFNYCVEDGIQLGLYQRSPLKQIRKKEISQDTISIDLKGVFTGGYNSEMLSYLEPTKLGKAELQKLYSFKKFLEDFGSFENKKAEEVIIWEFYLCYAQIFGLTEKILKSGYDKLIKNSAFEIDGIKEIQLEKLNIIDTTKNEEILK